MLQHTEHKTPLEETFCARGEEVRKKSPAIGVRLASHGKVTTCVKRQECEALRFIMSLCVRGHMLLIVHPDKTEQIRRVVELKPDHRIH